jgi:hypothetical protein
MNIFGKTRVPLFLTAIMLASCSSFQSTPTMSDAEIMETAISTVGIGLAETQSAMPTVTQVPLTFTPKPTPESYLIVDSERMVRNGPGIYSPMIGTIEAQKKYRVIGKHVDNTSRVDWWLIDLGNNRSGWVTGVETRFVGNAEAVPDVAPSSTPTAHVFPTSTPLAFTDPSIPLSERIVYYYLVGQRENPIPEGAVNAGASLLASTYADETYTSDTAADLRTALEIVLHDERNYWLGPGDFEAEIVDVTFRFGHAKVFLQGEYYIGESHSRYVPLAEARMQILLTVFANPAVQSAAVSLNEDTIGNLGISRSENAKPADYVFTRAEIETYLQQQAYVTPSLIPPIPPTPTLGPTSTPFVSVDPSLPLPELPPDAIDLQWITAYGLPGDQSVTKIRPTKDGGFILVGNEVLLKLRADGFIEWQKSLGQVRALDVLETSAGDFILAGDRHWIKLDSQGDILWQNTFGGPSYHRGPILRFVEESNGNIVVEALFSRAVFNAEAELQSFTEYAMQWDSQRYPGNVRYRSGETLWAGGEYWVGKTDPNNSWLKVIPFPDTVIGPTPVPAYDIGPLIFIQDIADGGALVGVPVHEYPDPARLNLLYFSYVLITRFSGDGSVRWQKNYGTIDAEEYEDFHAFETKSGDFIVAGTFVDFEGGGDVWIWRLDRAGNSQWLKLYGTEGKDTVAVIQELSNGDLIFAGRTNGAGTGDQDMWILKTNAQGEIPNCGLALHESRGGASGIPTEIEKIALEGVSVSERETIPSVEDEQGPFGDADAQVISLCAARPSP